MFFIIYLIIYLLVKKLYNVAINYKIFKPYCKMIHIPLDVLPPILLYNESCNLQMYHYLHIIN